MSGYRLILTLGAALLIAVGTYVWVRDPLFGGAILVVRSEWSLLAVGDLILGFLVFSPIIWFAESSKRAALVWIAPLFVMGNIVSVLYLLLRWHAIRDRLTRR